jgi:hypothetical protein
MNDNDKCQNEGCGAYVNHLPVNCELYFSGQTDECRGFTTTPTTSIPVAELEELHDHKRLSIGKLKTQKAELQDLHDKIKELEGDKERLDWLDGNRSDMFGVSVASFDVWLIRKTSGDIAAQGSIRNVIEKARKQSPP